jgi:hypothetical protein
VASRGATAPSRDGGTAIEAVVVLLAEQVLKRTVRHALEREDLDQPLLVTLIGLLALELL